MGAITVLLFVTPLVALVVRAPWSTSWRYLGSPAVLDALRLSLICSSAAAALTVVFGTPLAWLLARYEFPGRAMIRTFVTLSMVLPPVVSGVALLLAFGRRGLFGRFLDQWFGVQLPFSTTGVILAETFVAMPFLVLTAEGAFRTADLRLEEAAATLGARRWTVFRRITLPAIAPSLISAQCSPGPGRSASSVRPSPSPATSRVGPRRCPWPCTSPWRRTRARPSC